MIKELLKKIINNSGVSCFDQLTDYLVDGGFVSKKALRNGSIMRDYILYKKKNKGHKETCELLSIDYNISSRQVEKIIYQKKSPK
jgi:hypothetical protein